MPPFTFALIYASSPFLLHLQVLNFPFFLRVPVLPIPLPPFHLFLPSSFYASFLPQSASPQVNLEGLGSTRSFPAGFWAQALLKMHFYMLQHKNRLR